MKIFRDIFQFHFSPFEIFGVSKYFQSVKLFTRVFPRGRIPGGESPGFTPINFVIFVSFMKFMFFFSFISRFFSIWFSVFNIMWELETITGDDHLD